MEVLAQRGVEEAYHCVNALGRSVKEEVPQMSMLRMIGTELSSEPMLLCMQAKPNLLHGLVFSTQDVFDPMPKVHL
eukprot:3794426-Amphidinium_carterae.1